MHAYLALNRWQLQHSTTLCYGMDSNSVGTSKVTNAFLGFSSGDQQVLEVIEDYFTSPVDAEDDDLEDDRSCMLHAWQYTKLGRYSNVAIELSRIMHTWK